MGRLEMNVILPLFPSVLEDPLSAALPSAATQSASHLEMMGLTRMARAHTAALSLDKTTAGLLASLRDMRG